MRRTGAAQRAGGSFAELDPGEAKTITATVRRDARYALRRRCTTTADGVVDNDLSGGVVRTVSPVRITRC